jgi:hypothetical protein
MIALEAFLLVHVCLRVWFDSNTCIHSETAKAGDRDWSRLAMGNLGVTLE